MKSRFRFYPVIMITTIPSQQKQRQRQAGEGISVGILTCARGFESFTIHGSACTPFSRRKECSITSTKACGLRCVFLVKCLNLEQKQSEPEPEISLNSTNK